MFGLQVACPGGIFGNGEVGEVVDAGEARDLGAADQPGVGLRDQVMNGEHMCAQWFHGRDVAQQRRDQRIVVCDRTFGAKRQFQAKSVRVQGAAVFEPFDDFDQRIEAIDDAAQRSGRSFAALVFN